jgi:selenide,water dikinase
MKISSLTEIQKTILADPQTSGGLLVSVDEGKQQEFESVAASHGYTLKPFGQLVSKKEIVIQVR